MSNPIKDRKIQFCSGNMKYGVGTVCPYLFLFLFQFNRKRIDDSDDDDDD